MEFETLTIGGSNKNFFFFQCPLELIILGCLKKKKIKKHIHIGRLTPIRLLIINSILIANKILYLGENQNKKKFNNFVLAKAIAQHQFKGPYLNILIHSFLS